MDEIKRQLQSLIFLSQEAIPISDLAEFFELDQLVIKDYLKELKDQMDNSGINLQIKDNSVFFVTNPICGEVVNKFFNPTLKIRKLSKTSMETLAIIAFKGPITKGEIENIKAMNVDASIQALQEKKLIYSSGRKKGIGNPKLYEVTDMFYKYLGLNSKEQLFELEQAKWFEKGDKGENQ